MDSKVGIRYTEYMFELYNGCSVIPWGVHAMQSKKEIAYRKLLSFYVGLVALTGLASISMIFSPQMLPCNQFSSANASAPIAYLCSADGVNYLLQVMVYALGLSLGCLLLVLVMQKVSQPNSR
jgi:hypothetical protein